MTNIDAVSLASVTGGAPNMGKNPPTSSSGSTTSSTPEGAVLAGDAAQGCVASIKNGSFNFGSCLSGALSGVISGLGFGSSSAKK